MVPSKRLDLLVDCVDALSASGQNWIGVAAGDGPTRCAQEERVRALGIEDRIAWRGYVQPIWDFLMECDVLLFTSEFEGFGRVVLEALLCGVPVVSVPVGEALVLAQHDAVYLADWNGRALADAVAGVRRRDEGRLTPSPWTIEHYDLNATIACLSDAYRTAAKGKSDD
jgi:glycosyltransferase involved in cell wall biosynthesis